MAAKLKTCDNR